MRDQVKAAVQLVHGEGLGVDDRVLHGAVLLVACVEKVAHGLAKGFQDTRLAA